MKRREAEQETGLREGPRETVSENSLRDQSKRRSKSRHMLERETKAWSRLKPGAVETPVETQREG